MHFHCCSLLCCSLLLLTFRSALVQDECSNHVSVLNSVNASGCLYCVHYGMVCARKYEIVAMNSQESRHIVMCGGLWCLM